jgi:hypothetical protein
MSSARVLTATAEYSGPTASMQVDPEARHCGGAASESSSAAFPIASARCATHPAVMEWVPDRERAVVPEAMTALCRRCPGRQGCLLWALAGRERGYWAGTTTADREQMAALGQRSVQTADWLQQLAADSASAPARHPRGQGSYWWYRRQKCRCAECRAANSARRAQERAKAKTRRG